MGFRVMNKKETYLTLLKYVLYFPHLSRGTMLNSKKING